ncbi:MAG: efflux RND transporter periplasmic adaptor subunit [Deltaproteobacteria bacterium]|nr:efflux RND transporter periplasmic adaptor subunit [Deltaproteobacteria bacterium]
MKAALVLLALVALVACRAPVPEQHDDHHDDHDDHAAPVAAGARPHDDDDDDDDPKKPKDALLRVEPGMLRDLRLTTQKAEARPGGDGVLLLGALQVDEDHYAEVAVALPSRVSRVLAAAGDVVKEGQALLEVESVELGRARAALLQARARRALAQAAVDRKRALGEGGVVAPREIAEAEADERAAHLEEQAATSGLSALGVAAPSTLDAADTRLVVRAPIGGTVIARDVARGAFVDGEHTLFRIADEHHPWLVVNAFERDAVRVHKGSPARVRFPALPGRTFDGKVALIGRTVDPSSRTIPVRIVVDNADGVLRTGMSASAFVPLGEDGAPVLVVPAAAVQRVGGGWAVFVPRPETEGTFEPRAVGRGRDLGGDVEIVSGLKPGESVVVDGAFVLKAELEKQRGGGEHDHHH